MIPFLIAVLCAVATGNQTPPIKNLLYSLNLNRKKKWQQSFLVFLDVAWRKALPPTCGLGLHGEDCMWASQVNAFLKHGTHSLKEEYISKFYLKIATVGIISPPSENCSRGNFLLPLKIYILFLVWFFFFLGITFLGLCLVY